MTTPSSPAKLVTADEFDHYPERSPEGGKLELVEGRVIARSPVGRTHSKMQIRLVSALDAFIQARTLGEVNIEVGYRLRQQTGQPDTTRVPDVSFLTTARLEAAGSPQEGTISGPPDLAVEVMSPDDHEEDVNRKLEDSFAAGCPRAWVVRPRLRNVTVHRADGTARTYHLGDTLTSDDAGFAVEGFALPLAELFE